MHTYVVDLDNEVSKRGLESLYFNGITDHNHESHPTLHTRSVFVRSYRGADGVNFNVTLSILPKKSLLKNIVLIFNHSKIILIHFY